MPTITFVRHGNATKWSGKREEDHDRPLSVQGVFQAQERRGKLGNPTFDLIISSPAPRCVDAAKIIAGKENPLEVITASRLYLPADPNLWDTFDRIAYAPLRKWVREENDPSNTLERYGTEAWDLIYPIVLATGAKEVLVAGHAPFLNAIGVHHRTTGMQSVKDLYDIQFEECEGFIMWDNGKFSTFQG